MSFCKSIFFYIYVTQPIYESRTNWIVDPAPPVSRPSAKVSPAPTPAILMPSSGAKMPEIQEKEKKEGCAISQSQFGIPPG